MAKGKSLNAYDYLKQHFLTLEDALGMPESTCDWAPWFCDWAPWFCFWAPWFCDWAPWFCDWAPWFCHGAAASLSETNGDERSTPKVHKSQAKKQNKRKT